MNLIYRRLSPSESFAYREVRLESLRLFPDAFEAIFSEEKKNTELMFESLIKQQDKSNFVVGAFEGTSLVGICGFVNRNQYSLERTGTIIQMYVKKEYRGKNIGLHLTNKVIEEVRKIPKTNRLVLEVKKTNSAAIAVYERAGFRIENIARSSELRYMEYLIK
ncbi:GNAT family N-acetyltransferase [Aliikangiella coralliicola]|uniref:GNAT family N-acetyltransferase n=1 Tax=Aliikangiella coralliicola TaxID=2592383 RepID=A0A545UCB1_9GAMM|nr:GNAT family N-acetyltransferase [Aliikangiella coralliicola]TQV87063.1 GNAT family N-acetyltransferase [Aliikangiella coralliicola]